jgi:hypothetical protein
VADDPGDFRARRQRRRRRTDRDAEPDASSAAPIDAPQPVEPDPTPAPIDETRLPTFLHAGPGPEGTPDAVSGADRRSRTVAGRSRRAADRIVDGSLVDSPIEAAPPTPRPVDEGWLPMLEDRSPDPEICPFLRAVDDADRLVAPVETPDPANRCAALRDAVPQSLRQQELVCLSSGHVNCPRYLRGALVIAEDQ